MRGVDFVYDALLPLGRAQTPKLGRELANDDFSIAVDQGAGVAFELLQRIPVRRAGVAGAIFRPIWIAGVPIDHTLAVYSKRQVRIDPNKLGQQLGDLVGDDRRLVKTW